MTSGENNKDVTGAQDAVGIVAESAEICKNCGAALIGPWCGSCGQKHLSGPPTVGLFLEEFITALIHADSRFWRTLRALVIQPGFLAREFFEGRRARYLPPVRLYLGLSLLFFLYLSFDTQQAYPGREQPLAEDSSVVTTLPEGVSEELERALGADVSQRVNSAVEGSYGDGSLESESDDLCEPGYTGPASELIIPRVRRACEQIQRDGGYALVQSFMGKLPTAMFLLMPLFALCMKLWYRRPKRYFTEHLVLQINNHSAIFLFLLAGNLVNAVAGEVIGGWVSFGIVCYVFVYCYRSLRVYYGQERLLTRLKFFSLMYVYAALVLGLFIFTGLASLFSLADVG